MLRVISLNLNGIRSAASKGLYPWLAEQQADIVCLQEIKAQESDLAADMLAPLGYFGYFHCAEKRGYSGVAIYSKQEPRQITRGVGVEVFDAEGRYIQADLDVAGMPLSVVSLYLPSGSSSDERQAAKFRFMEVFRPKMDALRASGREVIVCGDWNIAHQQIDLKNWKSNQKNSGFLPEERQWLSNLLAAGWTDVYRALFPEAGEECYTWWSNRGQAWAKNVGWRLDYQLATAGIGALARHAAVYKAQRFSDHAPLTVDYAVTSAP